MDMKTHRSLPARGWAASAFLLALTLLMPWLRAADADPPSKINYQGYLVDANGVPLGNTAPRNYDVEFRLYDAADLAGRSSADDRHRASARSNRRASQPTLSTAVATR